MYFLFSLSSSNKQKYGLVVFNYLCVISVDFIDFLLSQLLVKVRLAIEFIRLFYNGREEDQNYNIVRNNVLYCIFLENDFYKTTNKLK